MFLSFILFSKREENLFPWDQLKLSFLPYLLL